MQASLPYQNYSPLGDSWLYDHAAQTWQQLDLPLAPSPREHYAMCYNRENGLVYLYGGKC